MRPSAPGDGPWIDGLVVPGLVNAHTHLELSPWWGRVSGGGGFSAWARRLMQTGPDPSLPDGAMRAQELVDRWGVALVHDISNGGGSAPWLRQARLAGVVHHEVLGRDPAQVAQARAVIGHGGRSAGGRVWVRPSPHALLSTRPAVVAEAIAACRQVPASLHVGETAHEERLLREGDGPLAAWLDALGRQWRDEPAPGVDAMSLLDRLGVLDRGLMLVHGIHLDRPSLRRAARAGATLVSCPRSNLHIEGSLPDLSTWLAAGGCLALGTDSLASCPDLDVLGEIPVLARAFPEVPVSRWLGAATWDGLGAVGRGVWPAGRWPGVLELDAGAPEDLACRVPERRWILPPDPGMG